MGNEDLKAERDILVQAILDAAKTAGMINDDAPIEGPHLLMLVQNLGKAAATHAASTPSPVLATAFEVSDQDVCDAARTLKIELSLDEAEALRKDLDLDAVSKAALQVEDLSFQTAAVQQEIAKQLRKMYIRTENAQVIPAFQIEEWRLDHDEPTPGLTDEQLKPWNGTIRVQGALVMIELAKPGRTDVWPTAIAIEIENDCPKVGLYTGEEQDAVAILRPDDGETPGDVVVHSAHSLDMEPIEGYSFGVDGVKLVDPIWPADADEVEPEAPNPK